MENLEFSTAPTSSTNHSPEHKKMALEALAGLFLKREENGSNAQASRTFGLSLDPSVRTLTVTLGALPPGVTCDEVVLVNGTSSFDDLPPGLFMTPIARHNKMVPMMLFFDPRINCDFGAGIIAGG